MIQTIRDSEYCDLYNPENMYLTLIGYYIIDILVQTEMVQGIIGVLVLKWEDPTVKKQWIF